MSKKTNEQNEKRDNLSLLKVEKPRYNRASPPQKNVYRLAKAWLRADPGVRVRVSTQQVYWFHAISRLGDALGERLDKLHACGEMVRFVASASRNLPERNARFDGVVKILEEYPPDRDEDDDGAALERWTRFVAFRRSRPMLRSGRPRKDAAA